MKLDAANFMAFLWFLSQAQRKEYDNIVRLTQHQQDLISSLQEEVALSAVWASFREK
jgi:hypothetical protein